MPRTILACALIGVLAACGSGPVPAPSSPPAVTSERVAAGTYTHVTGTVRRAGSGEPVAGAWVQFDSYAGNVHTTTGRDGAYEVPVPDGVYTALAGGPRPDSPLVFDVVGPDNVVEIPGDTRVDFIARPS